LYDEWWEFTVSSHRVYGRCSPLWAGSINLSLIISVIFSIIQNRLTLRRSSKSLTTFRIESRPSSANIGVRPICSLIDSSTSRAGLSILKRCDLTADGDVRVFKLSTISRYRFARRNTDGWKYSWSGGKKIAGFDKFPY
jgi:hypothetical protein